MKEFIFAFLPVLVIGAVAFVAGLLYIRAEKKEAAAKQVKHGIPRELIISSAAINYKDRWFSEMRNKIILASCELAEKEGKKEIDERMMKEAIRKTVNVEFIRFFGF